MAATGMDVGQGIEEAFYRECARILGTIHAYRPWTGPPPNRWNNRHPGNGRFPGFGTIRMYGPRSIHISLRHPVALTRWCTSPEEVYRLVRKVMRSTGRPLPAHRRGA